MMCTLHEHRYTFLIISRSFHFRMENLAEKFVEKLKKKKHFIFSNFSENRVVCEIMWKNMVQPGRPQITTWSMRIVWWKLTATNTHSEYVILIAFPLEQW